MMKGNRKEWRKECINTTLFKSGPNGQETCRDNFSGGGSLVASDDDRRCFSPSFW